MSLANFSKILQPLPGREAVEIVVFEGMLNWTDPEKRLKWPCRPETLADGWDHNRYSWFTRCLGDWHGGTPPLFVIEGLRDLPGELTES